MLAAAAALLVSVGAAAAPPRLPADALPVPLIAQATDYSCGPASLMATLLYWNAPFDSDESSLYPRLGTSPEDGTPPEALARAAESFGLHAYLTEHMSVGDLRLALQRGDTVILDLQAWRAAKSTVSWSEDRDDGHYVVLVGLDADYAYLMDPSSFGAYAYVPLPELLERWHDYESRGGATRCYDRLGVLIHGTTPRRRYPGALIRML